MSQKYSEKIIVYVVYYIIFSLESNKKSDWSFPTITCLLYKISTFAHSDVFIMQDFQHLKEYSLNGVQNANICQYFMKTRGSKHAER